jgi:hypothetical protein
MELHDLLPPERREAGYAAGSALLAALTGLSLNEAFTRLRVPPYSIADAEAAWGQMHSVAHMWAAAIDVGMTDVRVFLRRAEELLDAMQARPDLACPDAWCCPNDVRSALGLPPNPTLEPRA